MSWVEATLGDLYKVASSKRVLKSDWKSEGIPFYRGREITSLSKYGYVENDLYITEGMYEDFNKNYGVPLAGDIMVTAIGTIGNTYIVKSQDKFYFKDASVLWLKKLEKDVDSNYINYWFKSSHFTNQLTVGLGATVDTLTIGKVQSLKINIPTLATQKKIVAKLDAIFAEIDKVTVTAEANAKNAEALFLNYLTQVFERNSECWNTKKLKEITFKITDGSHNPPKGIEYSDFLMFSSKNISDDKITFESPRFLTKEDYELENKRTQVSIGDVLLTIVGTIGRCAVVEDANLKITLQRSVSVIKPKPEINSRFLMYFFLSVNKFLNDRARGAAQKGIYLETLRDLDIRFPSLSEQESLVAKLDDFSSISKGMAVRYQNKIEQLSFYKDSILKQAFNGELIKE